MAIKDLRKLDEKASAVAAAKLLLEEAGMTVVEGDIEVPLDEAIALVEGAGKVVLDEAKTEITDEVVEQVVEKLKADGFSVLSEEMMDKVDEELEIILAERVAEAKKDESGDKKDDKEAEADKKDDDKKDDDKKADDKEADDKEAKKEADDKKEAKKEAYLETLMGASNLNESENDKPRGKTLLEKLM